MSKTVACMITLLLTTAALATPLSTEDSEKLQEAQQAQQAGEHARTVELLEPLRAKHADIADLHRLLGHSYAALNRFDDARKSLTQALALGRLSNDVIARLAELERREDDLPAIIADLRLLVAIDPANDAWRITLADALVAGGAFEEARLIYEHAMQHQPSARLARRLGQVALQQQRPVEALEQLELAWHLGDRAASLPRTIGDLAYQNRQPRRALEWYDLAQQVEPSEAGAVALRKAELRLADGDLERAEREVTPIAGDTKHGGDAQVLLGRIRIEQGRVADAVRHFERAHQLGRTDLQLLAYIGSYYYNQQQYADAIPYLKQRIEAGDTDLGFERQYVTALLKAGETDEARTALMHLIERFGLDAGGDLVTHFAAATAE